MTIKWTWRQQLTRDALLLAATRVGQIPEADGPIEPGEAVDLEVEIPIYREMAAQRGRSYDRDGVERYVVTVRRLT